MLIESLLKRIKEEKIDEVILATSATVEGQTTAFYIQNSLKDTNVKISKLAQGRADDLASTLILASNKQIVLVPAMNKLAGIGDC